MPKLRCLWLRTRTVACRDPHRPISAPRPTESVRLRPDPDASDLLRRVPRRRVTARPIPSIQRTPTDKGDSTRWSGKAVSEGSSAYKNFSAHYEISQLGTSQKHSLKWRAGTRVSKLMSEGNRGHFAFRGAWRRTFSTYLTMDLTDLRK